MNDLYERFPIYSRIVSLYPKVYRQKYEAELLQTTADMLDDAPSIAARLAVWLKVAVDASFNISRQQCQQIGSMALHNTPRYIRQNSLVAGALLVPFCTAIAFNSMEKVIRNRMLFHTMLWSEPIITLWVLYFPAIALLLAIGSYVFHIFSTRKDKHMARLKKALDVKRLWPIAIPATFAFGILFIFALHDRVQCQTHSLPNIIHHVSNTWQCSVHN